MCCDGRVDACCSFVRASRDAGERTRQREQRRVSLLPSSRAEILRLHDSSPLIARRSKQLLVAYVDADALELAAQVFGRELALLLTRIEVLNECVEPCAESLKP